MRRLVKEKFECKDVGREAKNKIVTITQTVYEL